MRGLAVVSICGALSGCAALEVGEGSGSVRSAVDATRDEVEQRLAGAVGRAEAALGRLSRIESTRDPISWREEPALVPSGLLHSVSLDWTGPLVPLAERLAELSGYRFREVGARAVQPVLVDVHAVEKPIIWVLREVGFQGGTRVKVVVDARAEVVEVVHRAG